MQAANLRIAQAVVISYVVVEKLCVGLGGFVWGFFSGLWLVWDFFGGAGDGVSIYAAPRGHRGKKHWQRWGCEMDVVGSCVLLCVQGKSWGSWHEN